MSQHDQRQTPSRAAADVEQQGATSTAPIPAHAIVVGLDDSPQSAAALEWAASEAAAQQLPLRLIHTVQPPLWPDPTDASDFEENLAGCLIDARRALAESYPGLSVSWSQPYGAALPALTWASRFATLIVVGTRAHGPIRQLVSGSTAVELIADAHCPLVVVRAPLEESSRSGPVVLGLEGRQGDGDALQAAFREADMHRRTLVVLHASDYGLVERIRVERLVTTVRRSYPAVTVKVQVKRGDPAELLIGRTRHASLLVLGAHGRREAAGAVLGSVSQSVLRHAECPVLVARQGTLRRFGRVPGRADTGADPHGR